ncbi:probable LRR receptor-like serine/threonine-protein kinase At3g47570 [Nymphaea colorata]|nr:probable LRR receptor-like serine/threonine-protein kinase At3g47570 [Nymphaea colorata]
MCSDRNAKPQHKRANVIRATVCAIGGFTLFLVVGLLIVMAIRRKRMSKRQDSVPDLTRVEHPMISYREILQATGDFTDANLLGSGGFGSVYKAILSNGETVAVKVFNLSFEGASKSFDIECNVMRQIRHRNLVKIITSCCTEDFRALVLQYMPQGSLENCLHLSTHQLSLLQRLNIMIDVACALKYLHCGYSEPIVHCDLKPSNVLLDGAMTAYVGDFGIARMLLGKKTSTLTTTLGSTGYIAPEFGSAGKVSTKADVYSYGILLLEMLTRKKPTDAMFDGDRSLRQWVAEAHPDAILEVIDSHLQDKSAAIGHEISEQRESERCAIKNQLLVSIAEIGLSCSMENPADRMAVVEVVVALKKIRERLQFLETSATLITLIRK